MASEETQPNDINSRLKARLKPSVPPRNTSLVKKTSLSNVESEPTDEPKTNATSSQIVNEPRAKITAPPEKLVTFTLRVEEKVSKGLKHLCSEENITKETFLEAAYLVCEGNEQMMQQVLNIAKERRAQRRKAGIQRRAEAMTKYLQ